jgi:hypothetical protein
MPSYRGHFVGDGSRRADLDIPGPPGDRVGLHGVRSVGRTDLFAAALSALRVRGEASTVDYGSGRVHDLEV